MTGTDTPTNVCIFVAQGDNKIHIINRIIILFVYEVLGHVFLEEGPIVTGVTLFKLLHIKPKLSVRSHTTPIYPDKYCMSHDSFWVMTIVCSKDISTHP